MTPKKKKKGENPLIIRLNEKRNCGKLRAGGQVLIWKKPEAHTFQSFLAIHKNH
jgi:hypothetical protein